MALVVPGLNKSTFIVGGEKGDAIERRGLPVAISPQFTIGSTSHVEFESLPNELTRHNIYVVCHSLIASKCLTYLLHIAALDIIHPQFVFSLCHSTGTLFGCPFFSNSGYSANSEERVNGHTK